MGKQISLQCDCETLHLLLQESQVQAGSSILTKHTSALTLQLRSGLFPERFPLSTPAMLPSY